MMNRKPPKMDAPGVNYQKDKKTIHQVRHYKVITPLYGGGVDPAQNDPITIIRGTEVRGHLRFWWRALCGNKKGTNLSSMHSLEESIWGSSEKPSQVTVHVKVLSEGQFFQATDYRGRSIDDVGDFRSQDSYVAFPLRRQNAHLKENVAFDLEITFPQSYKDDVEAALWAWETFGGIGARTRRGFGALQCTNVNNQPLPEFSSREISQNITTQLNTWVTQQAFPRGVPHLTLKPDFKISSHIKSNVLDAWRDLIKQYQQFRQSRPGGNPRHPGKSYWPEPDEIRRKTGQSDRRHSPNHPVKEKFPRGKFGLPIIFQFKDSQDPSQTTLQGTGDIDRMASPLILRPMICSDGAVGIAVILEWDPLGTEDESYIPPGGLRLVRDEHTSWPVESDLNSAEAKLIKPMQSTGETNPLYAFLKTLR